MRRLVRLPVLPVVLGAAMLLAAIPSSDAQPAVPRVQEHLLGTWQLDPAKSRYSPGPPPRSETRTYTRDDQGMKGTISRSYRDGRQEVIEYRADFDQEYPVSGTEAYDAVRFRRIDSYRAEAVLSHAGRVFGTARRVISNDGQTMTITFHREDGDHTVNNVAVYAKAAK